MTASWPLVPDPSLPTPQAPVDYLLSAPSSIAALYDLIETWEQRYQTCWDAPASVAYNPIDPGFDTTTAAWDDPRPPTPFRGRWLDEDDARGAFIIVMPRFDANEFGVAYDDTASGPDAYIKASGRKRAVGAWDVEPLGLNPALLQGAYDGLPGSDPLWRNAVYKNLAALLAVVKAGGVSATIELEGS